MHSGTARAAIYPETDKGEPWIPPTDNTDNTDKTPTIEQVMQIQGVEEVGSCGAQGYHIIITAIAAVEHVRSALNHMFET
jgi:hypothetical protein